MTTKKFPVEGWTVEESTAGYYANKRIHGELHEVWADDLDKLADRCVYHETNATPLVGTDPDAEEKAFLKARDEAWAEQRKAQRIKT